MSRRLLITGGSGGIGSALAAQAATAGWTVFIGYGRRREKAEETAADIRRNGGVAQAVEMALDDVDSVQRSWDAFSNVTDGLDALVLSASPAPTLASFLKTTEALLTAQFQVNVVGNHRLLSEAWKTYFRKQKNGHVVGVLSEAMGPPAWAHMSSYVIGKAGLQTLLECALAEFGASGLRASALRPDYTETGMLMGIEEHILNFARSKRPDGRFLTADAVAGRLLRQLENPPADARLEIERLSLPEKSLG